MKARTFSRAPDDLRKVSIAAIRFVLKEMALAGREDKDQALKEFDGLLLKHIGFA